jgi:hypothetical protein
MSHARRLVGFGMPDATALGTDEQFPPDPAPGEPG